MGSLQSLLFLPGMIVHEFSHVLACLATGVKVHKVKWFGTSEAFVQHDKPGAFSGLVISLAPFVVGNLLGFWCLHQAIALFAERGLFSLVFLWFGFSMVLLSFPSTEDAQNTWQAVSDSYHKKLSGKNSITAKFFWLLTAPFVFIPLLLLLAIFLAFNYLFLLRLGWVAGFLLMAGA